MPNFETEWGSQLAINSPLSINSHKYFETFDKTLGSYNEIKKIIQSDFCSDSAELWELNCKISEVLRFKGEYKRVESLFAIQPTWSTKRKITTFMIMSASSMQSGDATKSFDHAAAALEAWFIYYISVVVYFLRISYLILFDRLR